MLVCFFFSHHGWQSTMLSLGHRNTLVSYNIFQRYMTFVYAGSCCLNVSLTESVSLSALYSHP